MRLSLRGGVLLGFAGALLCQTGEPAPVRARLLADLEFLTSEALAGRVSLSPQAEIAARYIAADFQRTGLRPAAGDSWLQSFPLVGYRTDPRPRSPALIPGGPRTAVGVFGG